jgi:hypothetical protein
LCLHWHAPSSHDSQDSEARSRDEKLVRPETNCGWNFSHTLLACNGRLHRQQVKAGTVDIICKRTWWKYFSTNTNTNKKCGYARCCKSLVTKKSCKTKLSLCGVNVKIRYFLLLSLA